MEEGTERDVFGRKRGEGEFDYCDGESGRPRGLERRGLRFGRPASRARNPRGDSCPSPEQGLPRGGQVSEETQEIDPFEAQERHDARGPEWHDEKTQ